jgi:3',5'-nucleoside bisphosphate phosphatase
MPAGRPFTFLCQQSAQLRAESNRADLHLHTCHSDGVWTPEQVVDRAKRRGLGAIAITDHDHCAGIAAAQTTARSSYPALEVIAGVEVTCRHDGRELHLLGYFFRADDPDLLRSLTLIRQYRLDRFHEMIARLPALGITVEPHLIEQCTKASRALGRHDVAGLLVQAGKARTKSEALHRFLRDGGPVIVPKQGLPVAEAISLIHGAGGVCSWAHPPKDVPLESLAALREIGLDAVEVEYPAFSRSTTQRLRELAKTAGLAVSGGSDCHGPTPTTRAIGTRAIVSAELERLRDIAQERSPAALRCTSQ